METQTTDRSNFPTLEVNGPITAQQIRGFLQQAGIELRLELAASYLNTFLLVEEKKARSARA